MLKGIYGCVRVMRSARWLCVAALIGTAVAVGGAPAVAWAAGADAEATSDGVQARATVTDWDGLESAVATSGTEVIEVSGALTADSTIEVESGNVTIDFADASTVTRSGDTATFVVKSGATLTLTGSVTVSGGTGSLVKVEEGGTLNVNGAITANGVNGSASFIDIAGALTMGEGGKISGWVDGSDGSTVSVHGSSSTFAMTGGEISGNTANRMGAGVRLTDGATLIMTGGAIKNNTLASSQAKRLGAGVYVGSGSSLTATASEGSPIEISGNKAAYNQYSQAGGGGVFATDEGTTVMLTGVSVNANAASSTNTYEGGGGGAYVTKGASLTVDKCMFENNTGYVDGQSHFESSSGGIRVGEEGVLVLKNSTITGSTGHFGAGLCIYGDDVDVEVTSSTISDNKAYATGKPYSSRIGAGVFVQAGGTSRVSFTGTQDAPTVISGNGAEQGAGGLYVVECDVELSNTNIENNKAPLGGGVFIDVTRGGDRAALKMTDCSITDNTADSGAGIYSNGNLTILDTRIERNTASEYGGGIYSDGSVTLTSGDVSENSAKEAGGVMVASDEFVMDGGSISNNTAGMAGGVENGGTFTMSGGDIVGNKATGESDGIGGGVANIGIFTMNGGRIFGNTAAYAANDFYNYAEPEQEDGQGGDIDIDSGWDGNHDMELSPLSDDGAAARAAGDHGTFSLNDPASYGIAAKGWFEDTAEERYSNESPTDPYTIKAGDTSEQYLTLGLTDPLGTITLTPQDMTAYTGGDSLDGDPFPTVRYNVKVALAKGVTLGNLYAGNLRFTVDGVEYELPTAGLSKDDYAKLFTDEGLIIAIPQLKATFKLDEDGSTEAEDDEIAGEYSINVDISHTTVGIPYAGSFGLEVDDSKDPTLTVRYVSDPDAVLSEQDPADIAEPVINSSSAVDTTNGLADAVIEEGATYRTNGKEELGLLGDDDSTLPQISLLFDDLIDGADGTDTTQLLLDHAEDKGFSLSGDITQFKYLDLINENDGNAWVSSDKGITIYWPIPEGVSATENKFSVYHFEGLHREYRDTSDATLEDLVADSSVVKIEDVHVEGNNVVFTLEGNTEDGSFSPFALSWGPAGEEPSPDPDPDPDPTPDPDPDPTPDPDPDPDPDPTPDPDPDPDPDPTPEPDPTPDPDPDPDPEDKPEPEKPGLPATGDPALAVTLVTAGAGAAAIAAAAVLRSRRK